jgi:hypothetical protein
MKTSSFKANTICFEVRSSAGKLAEKPGEIVSIQGHNLASTRESDRNVSNVDPHVA